MRTPALAVALSLSSIVLLAAQEPAPNPASAAAPRPFPQPEARSPRAPAVPVRVLVTLSRFEGEKKTLSLPYSFLVNAPEREWGERSSLRMGNEIPVRMGAAAADKPNPPIFSYKAVGTKIDCRANRVEDRYLLDIAVEQSSVAHASDRSASPFPDTNTPVFRSFNSSFTAALRDGQSTTIVAATDPVSGESVRIEVLVSAVR